MKSEHQQVLRTFWPAIRTQKMLLSSVFLTLLLTSIIRLLEPWPLALAVDFVLGKARYDDFSLFSVGNDTIQDYLLPGCALGVIAIAVLKGLCGYFTATRMALAGSRILSIIRKSLFTHLLRLPLSAHQELRAGDLTMRLINDIGMMRDAMVTAVMPLLSSLTVFTGMAGIMLWLNWQLTVVALLPVPLLVLVTVWRGRRIRDVNRVQRQHEGELAARSAEFMTAIATVQAMALEKDAIRAFEGPERQSLQQNVKARKQAVGLECLIELLIAGITAMVLLLGARSVLSGKMSAGELLVFLSYLKNMFRPVREFARYSTRLIRAFTAGERVAGLLHYLPVEYSVEGKKLPLSEMPDIRFENVSFTYREGKNGECGRTLHNVSFHLPSGHTLAVTGPSGAGKSTLSRLLLRLYEPDSGRILLGKNELHEFCVTSLRQRIGYLPQEPLLFGYSIRDNITLGAGKTFSDDEIIAAARQANAHEFISGLPQGYNTIVGERGNTLSGGQRQRIAIARVILLNTPFILLDEPGVGLDSINELAVFTELKRLLKNKTALIITHDLSLAAQADEVIFMEQGKITERGNHHSLMARQGRYAELWLLQKEGKGNAE